MPLQGCLQSLVLELEDRGGQRAYSCGELLHGRVWLELRGTLQLQALEVCARGLATVHWLESVCVGISPVYCDYTDYQTFLHHRFQLIPGKAGARGWFSAPGPWRGTLRGLGGPLPWRVLTKPSRAVPLGQPLLACAKGFSAAGF